MTPRQLAGRLAVAAFTAVFVVLWLELADGATGACDDGCYQLANEWWEDPKAHQWQDQLHLARWGAAACVATLVSWLVGWRRVAFVLGAVTLVLFVKWYGIAEHARFGPTPLYEPIFIVLALLWLAGATGFRLLRRRSLATARSEG